MVDRRARDELAVGLQQLVAGDITNDEFTDAYYQYGCRSQDRAVAEIAEFGWGLYDDTRGPYRLEGPDAVTDEIREATGRAALFLASELEYEWPAFEPETEYHWILSGWVP